MEAVSGLVMKEIRCVLKDIAWREVKKVWRKEAQEHPKLEVIRKLIEKECENCAGW